MKKGNLVLAGIFSLFAILVIIQCGMYPKGENGIPGPGFFPIIVSVLMLTAAISLTITSLRMSPGEDKPLGLSSANHKRVYISMGIMVLYVIIMPVIGFCVTSFLLMFGMMKWLSSYKYIPCCVIAIAVTALVFSVFNLVLNVSLNFGILF